MAYYSEVKKGGKVVGYRLRASYKDEEGNYKIANKAVDAPKGMTPAKLRKYLESLAAEYQEEVDSGYQKKEVLTFDRFIDQYFMPMHVENGKHKPGTVGFYRAVCEDLRKEFGKRNMEAVKSIDIEKFLNGLQKKELVGKDGEVRNYSASYVAHYRTVLKVIFNFAMRHDLIEKDPMRKVAPVKKERKKVDFMTGEEAEKFLEVLDRNAPIYWKTAMYILLYTGIRRGELVGLQWQDIDMKNGTMTIRRNVCCNKETNNRPVIQTTKSEYSDRILPLHPLVIEQLKIWKKEQRERYGTLTPRAHIFNELQDPFKPTRPDNVTQWLQRFEERNGLRQVSPHDLRHTCGSLLLEGGATVKQVQTMLGHADATTTLKYYCGTSQESLVEATEKLNTLIRNSVKMKEA